MQERFKLNRCHEDIICALQNRIGDVCHTLWSSVSMLLRNLLNEASMAVMLGILFPLLFLLVLPLVSLHVVLPVLLPLLGLVHHLPPLALHFFCRELPTSDRKKQNMETLLESIQCGWWLRQCSEKQITISKGFSDYLNSRIVARVSIIKLWELNFCCILEGNFWHIFSFIKLGFRAFLDINKTLFEGFVYVSPVYPAPWSEP